MKKSLKISMAVLIAIIILFAATGAILFYTIKSRTDKMIPLETKQLNEIIYSIKDSYVNMYIIKRDETYIAIDAGNDKDSILRELKKLDINPLKVSAVFLTHSDNDHVAALDLFKNAVVYISQEEEKMLNGEKARFAIFHNRISRPYTLLKDGQEVMVPGLIISCISTPGHTPGSMSFIVNGNDLFTGDTLSLNNGKAGIFSTFFNMNSEKQKEILKKMAHLKGITGIYTAHHGMTDNFSQAFEMWKGTVLLHP